MHIASWSCGPQSQRCDPSTSPVKHSEWTRTSTGSSPEMSPLTSARCSNPVVNERYIDRRKCPQRVGMSTSSIFSTSRSLRRRWAISWAIDMNLSPWAAANTSRSGSRAIVPSSFMISQQSPTSSSPARRHRSTVASVCPARFSTPPLRASSGNICPGRRNSSGFTPGLTQASAVIERSAAEMPVVVSTASIDTVKAVWWLSVLVSTIW